MTLLAMLLLICGLLATETGMTAPTVGTASPELSQAPAASHRVRCRGPPVASLSA